jgi:hypothetical protein
MSRSHRSEFLQRHRDAFHYAVMLFFPVTYHFDLRILNGKGKSGSETTFPFLRVASFPPTLRLKDER